MTRAIAPGLVACLVGSSLATVASSAAARPSLPASLPASLRLTDDQLRAAAKAAAARLPPVDEPKVDECKRDHPKALASSTPPSAAELDAAAACLRAAGALGAAIQIWNVIVRNDGGSREATDAQRQLGAGYEAAGHYAEAAAAYRAYATRYAGEPDARDKLVRSICTSAQLGKDDDVARDLDTLAKTYPKVKVEASLCDAIRPIVVPPP